MMRVASRALLLITFAAALQAGSSKTLYFTASTSTTSYVGKLDLGSSTHQHTTMLEYPVGSYNPNGGGTGICRLGNTLYWGDQTTASVHSADLADGKLINHSPSFISNLDDPQGVACDASREEVHVVDSIPGGGLRGVFFRSPKPGSQTKTLNITNSPSGMRSIKVVDGNLWFGSDDGLFRSERQELGSALAVRIGLTDGKIYEDFEVVEVTGKQPRIFANTYDWGGDGVFESELDQQHQNLTSPFHPMKGSGCQKGSEMTWGLAADRSATLLYWVVIDDADPNNMKIMYQNYESSGPAKVAYTAVSSGYGIYLDPADSHIVLV